MTFDLEAIKEQIQNAEIINKPPPQRKIIEESTGYYTLPCTKEPFNGDVIKLSGDEFYILYQRFSYVDEGKFRDKLHSMDEWMFNKPYRVQAKWIEYVPKWLKGKRDA